MNRPGQPIGLMSAEASPNLRGGGGGGGVLATY